jgi:hypothetical protein
MTSRNRTLGAARALIAMSKWIHMMSHIAQRRPSPPNEEPSAVMTGLVPVIRPNASAFGDVVEPTDKLRIGRNRGRLDGRDKPGPDGEGSWNDTAFEKTSSLSRWLGFGVRLLFAAAIIAYFVVRYLAFVPRAIQP